MARDKHNVCPLTITLPCNYVERMIHAQLSSAGVNQSPVSPWPRVAYGESIASSKQKFARSEENRRRYPLSRMINDAEVELKTSMVASQEKGGGRGRGRKRERDEERRGESRISRQFSELQV